MQLVLLMYVWLEKPVNTLYEWIGKRLYVQRVHIDIKRILTMLSSSLLRNEGLACTSLPTSVIYPYGSYTGMCMFYTGRVYSLTPVPNG